MKVFKYTAWIILILFTVLYIIPAGLLKVPYFQGKISQRAIEYLEEKLGTDVQIKKIELEFFNKLILKEVLLEDQAGDTLFSAKRIGMSFEIAPLLNGKFRFTSAQLFSFTVNLNKETNDSPSNLQFVLDAFKSEETNKETQIDLSIKKLNLRLGNLTYRVKDREQIPNKFNPNDISLNNISARINLNCFTKTELKAQIDKLSFTEKSNFQVKHLALDLDANTKEAKVSNLNIELPSSSLKIADILVDYSQKEQLESVLANTQFQLSIKPSSLSLKDIAPFVPFLIHFEDKVNLKGLFSGTINNLNIENFSLSGNRNLLLQVNGVVQNVTHSNPENIWMDTNIKESFIGTYWTQKIISNLTEGKLALAKQIQNVGNIRFNGSISGSLNNLSTHGHFNTDIGNISANVIVGEEQHRFIKGKISTPGLDLKTLTENNDFGTTVFDIDVNTIISPAGQLSGKIDADIKSFEYKSFNYDNIVLTGNFTPSGYDGLLNINNPNGKISANGSFLLKGKDSEFNFAAQLSDLRLDKLNLTEKYQNPLLSFSVDANFIGDKIDNLLGHINLHDLSFSTDKGSYLMDKFDIHTELHDRTKEIQIISDIISGRIDGGFSLKSMVAELKQTLSTYLPSFASNNKQPFKLGENNFSFNFTFNNNEALASILELPIIIYQSASIDGYYDSIENKIHIEGNTPIFKAFGSLIESGGMTLDNRNDNAQLDLRGTVLRENDSINIKTSIKAENDIISSAILWNNTNQRKHTGELKFDTKLSYNDNKNLTATINIKSSPLTFNNSIWILEPTTITANAEKIEVNQLKAQYEDQFVKINGTVSHAPEDEIVVELNKVDLSYVFNTLNIKALNFGGIATGIVNAKDLYHTRQLTTNLDVTDFSFNNTVFGHLDLDGSWDDENQGIKMVGNVFKNDSTGVQIDGMIYPVREELSILFDAKNASAAFLRKYLDSVVQNFSGQVSGKIRLFGDLNHPTVEGEADVKNGEFYVKFLNTYYTFSDKVICTPDKMFLENVTFYDEHKNKATASGILEHKLFNDIKFSSTINFERFMVFNAIKASNPAFYGTVFGNGSATLKGTESIVDINASIQNTENTKITLNFMDDINVAEYNFINFVDKKKEQVPTEINYLPIIAKKTTNTNNNNSGTEIRSNLKLIANPNATIELIMDPLSGDKISAYGSGNMEIQYGSLSPLKVFGNYKIERGKYNFSLQQLLFRNFDIKEGSSVTFNGDPNTATLDINAAYTVSANLGDLDQQLLELSARSNVPVDCILLLNGPLNHPSISFDLDMPNATTELTRQVKSYIRTDDMMNRQILYLLVLSRFYTSPEYARNDSRANNDLSFLTATLSTQISNMLGLLSDKFQIGTKFHQTYEGEDTSTEVEVLLSSTLLNNRLIINGNFGYSNNPFNKNTQENGKIPLVGDFDVEYKLTKSGDIRLKGFNHYNYRNYYSLTPEMTQGIGILFRKDFDRFPDLFKKNKN